MIYTDDAVQISYNSVLQYFKAYSMLQVSRSIRSFPTTFLTREIQDAFRSSLSSSVEHISIEDGLQLLIAHQGYHKLFIQKKEKKTKNELNPQLVKRQVCIFIYNEMKFNKFNQRNICVLNLKLQKQTLDLIMPYNYIINKMTCFWVQMTLKQ